MSTAALERLSSADFGRRATDEQQCSRRERPRLEVVPCGVGGLDEAAAMFTSVRPCDRAPAARVRRGAPELDARASATAWIVGEGLRSLDRVGRQRILDGWRAHHHDRVGALVADGGCEVGIGGARVTGALRLALLEWLPLSCTDVAVYEGGLFRGAPANALTLLLRPPTIWPAGEVATAERLYPRGPRFEPERFAALELYARGRAREAHLARLREAARRIEAQLPVTGFPVASATVAVGCAVVAADEEWCTAIAARQLARYATSGLIGPGGVSCTC